MFGEYEETFTVDVPVDKVKEHFSSLDNIFAEIDRVVARARLDRARALNDGIAAVGDLIGRGYETSTIFRRTIPPIEPDLARLAEMCAEYGATHDVFTNPALRETEDYITGRFG